ncbi:MAG: cupin domain-containing protein [archaeon]
MVGFTTNIEKDTLENENYRKVIFTGEKMQLVLMSLKPGEDIPMEIHNGIDQFLRIEQGEAYVKIGDEEFNLKDDDVIIIPAGNHHYVKNTSADKELKLYSIYATPEHAPGTIHKTKAEADAAEHEHHH